MRLWSAVTHGTRGTVYVVGGFAAMVGASIVISSVQHRFGTGGILVLGVLVFWAVSIGACYATVSTNRTTVR